MKAQNIDLIYDDGMNENVLVELEERSEDYQSPKKFPLWRT